MTSITENYIYAVTKNLPSTQREDIAQELRTLIHDMLPPQPTEQDLEKVLYTLGKPENLARRYQGDDKFLIGRNLYPHYLTVLRIVGVTLVAIMFLTSLITTLMEPHLDTVRMVIDFCISFLTSAFSAVLQAIAWVTIVFAIIEKSGQSKDDEQWDVHKLEAVPNPRSIISLPETVVNIVFSLAFGIMIVFFPHLLAFFRDNGHFIPLFNLEVLAGYAPYFILLTIFQVAFETMKLIRLRWTFRLATMNLGLNILNYICAVFWLGNNKVYNQDFIDRASTFIKLDGAIAASQGYRIIAVGLIIILIISIWDSIDGFRRSRT